MAGDPFAPPEQIGDASDPVVTRARRNLYSAAATSLFFGLGGFCCNPFLVTTTLAFAASWNAMSLPGQYRISLEDDYPSDVGGLAYGAGVVGMCLAAAQLALQLLAFGMVFYLNATA